jgi:hypothetical protein
MPIAPLPDTISQSQFIDTQDTDIDIEAIYNNITSIIDQYRSHVSVVNNKGLINQLITALNTATQTSTSTVDPNQFTSQIIVDQNPQESRCHAFYRLIGLPIIPPSGNLYSPGFDASSSFDNSILNQHYQAINNIQTSKPALFSLMDARELNTNGFYAIFSQSNPASTIANINASVLALSSVGGGQVRAFSDAIVNSTDPFDTVVANQSYSVLNSNTIYSALLTAYTDVNGNLASQLFSGAAPNYTNPSSTAVIPQSPLIRRAHIIKPFMVDPRVDITVQPPQSRVCAPFITDSSKSVYAGDTTSGIVLVRPFIEYICRSRFSQAADPGTIPAVYTAVQSYISGTPSLTDQNLIDQITQGVATTLEDQIFQKNFNIMRAMIDRLADAIEQIQTTESNYHWLPIPDPEQGLEGAIGTQSTSLQTVNGGQLDPLATTLDRDIGTLTAKAILQAPNVQVATPDVGGRNANSVQPLPDPNTTVGFGSKTQNSLDSLIKQRAKSTDTAANALRDIEIIMGEFTGLGLCDIIVIYTALWTIDPTVLVNMLDDQAFARMASDPSLQASAVSSRASAGAATMSAQAVLAAFEAQILLMFQVMDRLYTDRTQFNTK